MPRKSSQTEPEINLDQQLPADLMDSVPDQDAFPQSQSESAADPADSMKKIVEDSDDASISQTETESVDIEAAGPADTIGDAASMAKHQTDLESTLDEETILGPLAEEHTKISTLQTETELESDEPEAPGIRDEESPDSADIQTGSENNGIPAPGIMTQSSEAPDHQTDLEQAPDPSSAGRRRRPARKTTADESRSDTAAQESPSQDDPAPVDAPINTQRQARTSRRRRATGAPVLSIDAQRTVQTADDKLQADLLDLVESLKSRKILTDTIQGVERSADNPNISYAVLYHGEFKVIIPAEETVEPPSDFRGRLPGDVMHYLVTKRLGAEVDYVVKGIERNASVAAASRLEAMAIKRREYYFGTDRDGNNLIHEGVSAEARIVSVIRAGIFIDLFGLETYIPLRELSYQRWMDATGHFQPGQRVLVKILSLNRTDRARIRVAASVKQAGENPYEKALRKYSIGSRYVGTVSMVDTTGVFVALDGGIDCLCSYPRRGRPPRGSRVTVRILGINNDTNRIWGAITHMTTPR